MEFNYFNTDEMKLEDVVALCPLNEYRIVSPKEPRLSFLPSGIQKVVAKSDSVLVTVSGGSGGTTYAMYNINRPDEKDKKGKAIDQNPFMISFVGEMPTASGTLVQHGAWPDRTTYPGKDFFDHLRFSGLGTCYPITELPTTPSGSIFDLKIASNEGAWTTLINEAERFVEEKKTQQERE